MPDVFQPVPRTVELTVQGSYIGQLVENKFYAQAVETITDAMVTALAGVVADWWNTSMKPLLPSAYVHTRVVARDLSTEASFEAIDATHAGVAGSLGDGGLPGNVTLAIHRNTGLSGKKAKSRIYWPGFLVTSLSPDGDDINTTLIASILVACDDLRSAILADTSATWEYGYPQRILDHVKLTTANFIAVLAHSVTDNFVDSQRRRLKGRGR